MSRFRSPARQTLIQLKCYVVTHPHLKALVLRWLAPFPGLKARLKMVGNQLQYAHATKVVGPKQLSPRARQIYNKLKAAIERRQQGQR